MTVMKMIAGPIVLLLGAFMLIGQYEFIIDPAAKTIGKYVRFFFRFGKAVKYNRLEYFYLTRTKFSMRYGKVASLHVNSYDYNAYLLKDEDYKFYLFETSDKRDLLNKLKEPSEKLGLKIHDLTEEPDN